MSRSQDSTGVVRAPFAEDLLAPLYRRLLAGILDRLEYGCLSVTLPDGGTMTAHGPIGAEHQAGITVRSYRALRRLLLGGDVGFAEAYIAGDWDTPDLPVLLTVAARNRNALGRSFEGMAPLRWLNRLIHLARPNTRRGSRRNIAAHYDLGNDFYAAWLDPGMTYSAAIFAPGTQKLEDAQQEKYRRLAEAAALKPGHHVLEIGCGWGGFAVTAARDFGCRVTAVTVSREQWQYARERIAAAGLADRVEVRLQDYRDVEGTFDAVVSVEMFEAVGEAYWPAFAAVLRDRLRPGGRAALQVITIDDTQFDAYRRSADFIQRHVFPGGMLPSPSALRRVLEKGGLRWLSDDMFGPDYARTLAEWHRRFVEGWPRIERLGFDDRFRRFWTYYLAYCEAGFTAGSIDVGHFVVVRP